MIKNIIDFVFASALFFNALIFIPQAIKIWKEKTARGVSLWTFLGFLATQLFIVAHGIIHEDYILAVGYLLAMFTCGAVVFLILIYGKNRPSVSVEPTDLNHPEMLDKIIALMPGHVYWIDRKGCYLGCNDQQAISAGLTSRKEIVGKRNKDLPWNSNTVVLPEALDRINDEVMKTRNTITTEEPGTLIDGTKKMFLSNKVPLTNNKGDVIGMVGISIDITEKKQAQESLRQANRARLEFMYTASHEIRNPMSSVVALADRLRGNLETLQDIIPQKIMRDVQTNKKSSISHILSEALENCQDAGDESKHALASLKNLTVLNKMQLEGVTNNPVLFNLQQLLELSIKKSTYPNTNNIQIEQLIDPSISSNITIEATHLMTALSIVIGNAFRFSRPDGKINITVKKSPKDENKWLVISVQDFGAGMHQEQIDRLSLPLLDTQTKRESQYAKPSVQLSRVKMYLEASGGQLNIKSTLQQGTEVILTVAYQPAPMHEAEETTNYLAQPENNTTERLVFHTVHAPICSILLIEDDVNMQKITVQTLVELGYQVDIAKNGAEAIKMAKENNYTIALLDITLPDINGLDVMRKIREFKKEDEMIFIALSSHSSEEEEDYFMTQGVMALLAKPVTSEELKNMLDTALETKARLEHGSSDF